MKIIYKTKIEKGTVTGAEYVRVKKNITKSDFVGDHPHSNTVLFDQQLRIAAYAAAKGSEGEPMFYLDDLPSYVTIERDGIMATVTIDVEGLL